MATVRLQVIPSFYTEYSKKSLFISASVYYQLISFPAEFNIVQIRHLQPFVSTSWAPTVECTSSLFSCVPCWLGVTGTRARWFFKNSWFWDNNKLLAARGISCELDIMSWTRYFLFRVTEFGPKSRDHSTPSLETAKIMLLCCRLKVYKMRIFMKF